MDGGLIALLILLALGLLGFYMSRRLKREGKKLGAKLSCFGIHMHGFPGLNGGEFAKLFFADKNLTVRVNKKTYELDYQKITAVAYGNKNDLLKKDRSVIGRGIAGGILLGPVAAIIGGMSAMGKQKHIKGEFLILNYMDQKDEERTLIFDLKNLNEAKKAERFIIEKRPELVEPEHVTL